MRIEGENGEHTHVMADGTVVTHSHASDGSHSHGHTHTHTMPDGTVVTHSHGPEDGHTHSHTMADGTAVTHTHGSGHSHEAYSHDADAHAAHAHKHTHTHTMADGTVVTHTHSHAEEQAHTDVSPGQAQELPMNCSVRGAAVAGQPGLIELEQQVMAKNDRLAERNRAFFLGRKLVALNLMSSPGSGKTTLLERTLRELDGDSLVLEGDQETSRDAARIRDTGVPVVQINTGTGCHLEADMVWHGLEKLDPPMGATLFIENVGNLVCPALFDLGEDARVVLFSVTEGEDKPLKYPHMFRKADLVLLTKVDLMPHLDFDREEAIRSVRAVAPDAEILELSSKSGEGFDRWQEWIAKRRQP
ncbi:MAG: hydrogenase nickel incorporation protein HypB [Myxococcota bacterium]